MPQLHEIAALIEHESRNVFNGSKCVLSYANLSRQETRRFIETQVELKKKSNVRRIHSHHAYHFEPIELATSQHSLKQIIELSWSKLG